MVNVINVDDYEEVLNTSFKLLNIIGMHPQRMLATGKLKITTFLNFVWAVMAVVMAFMEYGKNVNDPRITIVWLQTTSFAGVMLACTVTLTVHRKLIKELIDDIKLFRPIYVDDDFGRKTYKTLTFWRKIFVFLKYMYFVAATTLLFSATFLQPEHSFVFLCPVPENVWWYWAMYVYQVVLLAFVAVETLGFLIFFMGMVILLLVQFEAICIEFKNTQHVHNLHRSIDYHAFLLSYSTKLSKVFSLSCLAYSCVGVAYQAVKLLSGTDIKNLLQVTDILVTIIISTIILFSISYFGEQLKEKSVSVAEGVYDSKWYLRGNKHEQFCVRMIIQMAQKPKTLSLFGMIDSDFNTFVKLYRLLWSIYTLFMRVM